MPRTFLIDGYNLLLQIPEFSGSSAESLEQRRERLLRRLVALSAGRRCSLRVVFDGTRAQVDRNHYPGLEVLFALPPADQYLRQVIAQNEGNRELIVVSSDRKDIGNFARVSGVGGMTSPAFWKWMTALPKKRSKTSTENSEDRGAPPGWTTKDDDELRKNFEEE